MMRFDMTFDDTLPDGSSLIVDCIKFSLLLVLFKSLKANFQKKIFVEIHVLEVSWVS